MFLAGAKRSRPPLSRYGLVRCSLLDSLVRRFSWTASFGGVSPIATASIRRSRRTAPVASGVQPVPPMMPNGPHESLQLCLRLAAAPGNGAYKVTIELFEIDLVVESVDLDLRGAVRTAADRCAEQLRERGYAVTAVDVIGALEEALECSDVVPKPRDLLN
jgi:hypothetical protein